MQVTREEINPSTLRLTIVCDASQVTEGFTKAFKQITKKINVPGFRPGNAPKSILEGLVSQEDLKETAADIIVRSAYKKAIEQEGLQPDVSVRPSVEFTTLTKEPAEASFIAKVPLAPQIKLGEYKGLPVERPDVSVSDEEVDRQIEEFRKRRQTREAVTDRGLEEGDVAVVNIRIVDQPGEGRNFMSVAGQLFPQLDEAILGMKVEEMKNLELTFPETFTEKDWAGTTQTAQVTLNSISAVRLPELDDSFAQTFQTGSVDELREAVTMAITRSKLEQSREMLNEQLLDRLHERSEVSVSENMWEQLAERRLTETAEEQAQLGKSLEQYAKDNGMTIEELVTSWGAKAKLHVERALLIREVFSAENMQLTNNELQRELLEMARDYEVDAEKMVELLRQNDAFDELRFRAISRKVGDFLDQNARPVNAEALEETEAPAIEATAEAEATEEAPATEAPAADAPAAE